MYRTLLIHMCLLISCSALAEIVDFSSKESCRNNPNGISCEGTSEICTSDVTIRTRTSEVKVDNLHGPFLLSKSNNQIFDCGGRFHWRGQFAHVIEEDGTSLKISLTGDVTDCGLTRDQKYYWLAHERGGVSEQNSIIELRVFDSAGKVVYSKSESVGKVFVFAIENANYEIHVQEGPYP